MDTRGQEYSGYHTTYFLADYDKTDKSLYGDDNDQLKYQFFTPEEALQILKDQSINFEDKKRLILFKKRFEVLKSV